jgi:hypothetical protein
MAGARRDRRHRFALRAILVALVVLVAVLAGLALPLPDRDSVTRAAARPHHRAATEVSAVGQRADPPDRTATPLGEASVTIAANAPTADVPRSYFGLSTEYWTLPLFERDMRVLERVISLLRVPGNGPLVLRIGGDSADHSLWDPDVKHLPSWAFLVTPSWVHNLGTLVQKDHVRLIVDLNLVTDTPLTAAAWARAAETELPRHSIVGFEIGNEPDLYSHRFWARTLARSPLRPGALPFDLTPIMYVQDFAAYAQVIGEHAPDIPLIGPAVAHPRLGVGWVTTLIAYERPELGAVSGHLYPYSACTHNPASSSYATVARLLSRQATEGLVADVSPSLTAAHAAGLKFRLTELNSVTCGGKRGVSNSFATALWAPDALFTLMRAGVDGVNLHVRATAINAPFGLNAHGLYTRPLMYGLLLFTRALGPRAKLVRVELHAARSLDLSAWGVRVAGHILHVVVIDKGSHTVRIRLALPATGPATVQRLLAPSASASSGVTLAGQHLGPDGRWHGERRVQTIRRGRGGYQLVVPRYSAALVSVRA